MSQIHPGQKIGHISPLKTTLQGPWKLRLLDMFVLLSFLLFTFICTLSTLSCLLRMTWPTLSLTWATLPAKGTYLLNIAKSWCQKDKHTSWFHISGTSYTLLLEINVSVNVLVKDGFGTLFFCHKIFDFYVLIAFGIHTKQIGTTCFVLFTLIPPFLV